MIYRLPNLADMINPTLIRNSGIGVVGAHVTTTNDSDRLILPNQLRSHSYICNYAVANYEIVHRKKEITRDGKVTSSNLLSLP